MTELLQNLIDKQDNFEIIRDQIALILANEVANQKQLATNAAKDPADWDLRIYTERSNPWDNIGTVTEKSRVPVVNVSFENYTTVSSKSDVVRKQHNEGIFNIDCYGFGISEETASGQNPGDKQAAFEAQRAFRLVRNILMASINTYLQLRGIVATRMPDSVTDFHPEISNRNGLKIQVTRFALRVGFLEFSPQYEGETIEEIDVITNRAEDGEVLANINFDFT